MTDRPKTTRRRKPSPVTVFAASAAMFLAALGFPWLPVGPGPRPGIRHERERGRETATARTHRPANHQAASRDDGRADTGDGGGGESGFRCCSDQQLLGAGGRCRPGSCSRRVGEFMNDADDMETYDEQFDAMGARIRIMIDRPSGNGVPEPAEAGRRARDFILDFDRRLSRFRPDSELTAFNQDPRTEVPASSLLRTAIRAGLSAAEHTDGLVDPTLVDQIEAAGYRQSRAGMTGVPIPELLLDVPERRPAEPDPGSGWLAFEVDDENGVVRRPPGLRFDTGGTGKGLAADLVADSLAGIPVS
ncbi:MAG: FAD:protein FMN transferase [Solirubrobacterales bacterium]|nr:FAD:protein FMN transferase [Solirubrobacterales bacterium]